MILEHTEAVGFRVGRRAVEAVVSDGIASERQSGICFKAHIGERRLVVLDGVDRVAHGVDIYPCLLACVACRTAHDGKAGVILLRHVFSAPCVYVDGVEILTDVGQREISQECPDVCLIAAVYEGGRRCDVRKQIDVHFPPRHQLPEIRDRALQAVEGIPGRFVGEVVPTVCRGILVDIQQCHAFLGGGAVFQQFVEFPVVYP